MSGHKIVDGLKDALAGNYKTTTIKVDRRSLLSQEENEAAAKFVWEHYDRRCGGDRAKLELFAEATGLGFSIKIRCPNCKAKADITDTDSF